MSAPATQVWVAISVYVLVAILKKQFQWELSLSKILQIFSVTIFQKTPISQAFSNLAASSPPCDPCIQLNLFDF